MQKSTLFKNAVAASLRYMWVLGIPCHTRRLAVGVMQLPGRICRRSMVSPVRCVNKSDVKRRKTHRPPKSAYGTKQYSHRWAGQRSHAASPRDGTSTTHLSILMALYEGIPPATGWFRPKIPVMGSLDVLFDVFVTRCCTNSAVPALETPWRSCDVAVIIIC